MAEQTFFEKITYTDGIYPKISVDLIKNPNRLYAFPILGLLIKYIILIPVVIEIIVLTIWLIIAVMIINPFVILFTDKYWSSAYHINLGLIRLNAKTQYFVYGLTDQYPGFNLKINQGSLDINLPITSNKLYAFPILGFLIRAILMIPYFVYSGIISQAAAMGSHLLAWAVVLFKGYYPQGLFELSRDAIRVSIASGAYMTGLSDRYPSFYISMAHDKIKIILIAIAIILGGFRFSEALPSLTHPSYDSSNYTINNP